MDGFNFFEEYEKTPDGVETYEFGDVCFVVDRVNFTFSAYGPVAGEDWDFYKEIEWFKTEGYTQV